MAVDMTIRVATEADRAGLHALRHHVFVTGQGVPADLERDAADHRALHVVAVLDGRVVGTGRLLIGAEHGSIGRMAVAESARGQGIGTAVLRELEAQAGARNLAELRLHAQVEAIEFYRRGGYAEHGEPFVEAGIKHVAMGKRLPVLRAARDSDSAALIELIGRCFAEYPGCVLDIDTEETWLRAPASAYAHAGGSLTVAVAGGRVVACAGYKHGELKNLYVAAQARRGGLGARLSRVVEELARAAGATECHLWTDTRFIDAHRLYQRLGYEQTGEIRELHDLSDTSEYHFRKTL